MQRAVLMSNGIVIQSSDIDLPGDTAEVESGVPSLRQAKARMVQQFERSYLMEVLSACAGNISHAARTAGKERRSFQRLIRKHNIDIDKLRASRA